MRRFAWLPLLLLCTLTRAPQAQAGRDTIPARPRVNDTGFFVGADPLVYAWMQGPALAEGRRRGGGGIGLRFGWGFTPHLAIALDVPVTRIAVSDTLDVMLAHGDLALMFLPGRLTVGRRVLLPFVEAGLGFRSLDGHVADVGRRRIYLLEGEVLSLGLGGRLYLTPAIALALQGWWSRGDFNDERVGSVTTHNRGLRATSYRVQTGLEWHRGSPRGR